MAASPDSPTTLITGSAGGIGRATVEVLAERGHQVHGVDIEPQDIGVMVSTFTADLADTATCQALVEEIRPDVLVNNAAHLVIEPIDQIEFDQFDRTVAVNLKAVFSLSRAAVAIMMERGWGRIINISSIGARHGGVGDTAVYCATKGAVITLTKTFSRNFGPHGITTNAVAPGSIDTAMTSHLSSAERTHFEEQIPLRRLGRAKDVATVVAFLASDDAAYVNGATIDVNGGWYTA